MAKKKGVAGVATPFFGVYTEGVLNTSKVNFHRNNFIKSSMVDNNVTDKDFWCFSVSLSVFF